MNHHVQLDPDLLYSRISRSVSFAGSVSVLVTIQLMMALAIANLVSRKDAAPSILVAPLDGMVGKVLCLSDMPLIGQVSLVLKGRLHWLRDCLQGDSSALRTGLG